MVQKEIAVITGMLKPRFLMLTLYIIIISVYNMFQNGDTIFKNYRIVLKEVQILQIQDFHVQLKKRDSSVK